jgi:peptidoglycan/xylan/chitin deacetylase (PgdA/CDA1 family)
LDEIIVVECFNDRLINMDKNGALVISLDFEMLWGVFDKVDYAQKMQYFKNTQNLIPELLKLFSEYQINVTWATVGMLFNKNWDEWMNNFPEILPEYQNTKLSAYNYGRENKEFLNDNLCFAGDIIDTVKNTHGQEIATHTYSHYYCLEKGQNIDSFRCDLEMAIKLAKMRDIQLESLVFPRNQFNSSYLQVCCELGIKGVRINPANWYWRNTQQNTLQQKIFRTGDAYIGPKDKPYDFKSMSNTFPVQQRASRLLRPKVKSFKNNFKLKRIYSEMKYAANNNKIYHLWWHPHNFGNDPEGNLDDLKKILDYFNYCKKNYRMKSYNMREITSFLMSYSP